MSLQLSAQNHSHWCSTDEASQEATAKANEADLLKLEEAINLLDQQAAIINSAGSNKKADNERFFQIPVVVHLITQPGANPHPTANVEAMIEKLNQDYNLQNTNLNIIQEEYRDLAANANIRFSLAKFDPDGNPTTGINVVESTLADLRSAGSRNAAKYLINWPNDKYLNFWVVDYIGSSGGDIEGEVLGFATLPWLVASGSTRSSEDGIVIKKAQVNRNSTTATHEVGHYLGLLHPFQGGCLTGNCKFDGDKVCDIPQARTANFGCPKDSNTCPLDERRDNVTNFMDYADCQAMFTPEQVGRMRATLITHRAYLASWENLTTVGVSDELNIVNEVNAFPNPFQNEITIQVNVKTNEVACINIKDLLGRSYKKDCKKNLQVGVNNFNYSTNELGITEAGIYLLEITVGNEVIVKKIQYTPSF